MAEQQKKNEQGGPSVAAGCCTETTDKERKAIERLRRAIHNLPEQFWLYSVPGTLYVMRYGPDNRQVMDEKRYHPDKDYIVAEISRVDIDGGAW